MKKNVGIAVAAAAGVGGLAYLIVKSRQSPVPGPSPGPGPDPVPWPDPDPDPWPDIGMVYSPFGGKRMPICKELIIPGLPSFEYWDRRKWTVYPGGDYHVTVAHHWGENGAIFPIRIFSAYDRDLRGITSAELGIYASKAYPVKWDTGSVAHHETYAWRSGKIWYVLIYPTQYQCPEGWGSIDEMVRAMTYVWQSTLTGSPLSPPEEFMNKHASTCPTCGGKGYYSHPLYPFGRSCYECNRTGKILYSYLEAGIKDWRIPIEIKTGMGGMWAITDSCFIYCPYCGGQITYVYPSVGGCKRYELLTDLMLHIQDEHPQYPLTQRRY